MSKNKIEIEGNLTRDPELKFTASGKCVAKMSIAYNESYQKNGSEVKDTSFFDVVAWGELAESCKEFQKGNKVSIEGKIKQDRWEKDGKTQSKVNIVAFKIENMYPNSAKKNEPKSASSDGFIDDDPNDVPF